MDWMRHWLRSSSGLHCFFSSFPAPLQVLSRPSALHTNPRSLLVINEAQESPCCTHQWKEMTNVWGLISGESAAQRKNALKLKQVSVCVWVKAKRGHLTIYGKIQRTHSSCGVCEHRKQGLTQHLSVLGRFNIFLENKNPRPCTETWKISS